MKIFKKIGALLLASALCFSLGACNKDEVIDGSKITNVQFTLEFYDANNTVIDTRTVAAKLYNNSAPQTVKHITELIKAGYYDNTCVSNASSSWCEFGAYEYNADGNFVKKAYSGTSVSNKYNYNGGIYGEFEKNGFDNQILSLSAGALVLVHNTESDGEISAYNTGKATIAVCFSGTKFTKSEYCVFGQLVKTDAAKAPDDYEAPEDSVDRRYMSSYEIFQTVSKLATSKEGEVETQIYYDEVNDQVYTTVTDSAASDVEYYKGYPEENTQLTQDEIDDFNENKSKYIVIPATRVIIKTAKVK